MKLALALAVLTAAAYVGWRGTRAVIRIVREEQFTQHWLTAAEATNEHAHLIERPPLSIISDGWRCLGCQEPALPTSIWRKVCRLDATIARHPAGKQRKTGGQA